MKRLLIAWLLLTTALFGAWQIASAQMLMPIVNFGGPRATYSGPLDVYSTSVFGCYSLRACRKSYAGSKAANICDVSTGAVCSDVNTLANGDFDVATASGLTQCAVSCNVATLYEQSGGGAPNLTAINSARPVLTFNCIGSLPCMTFTRTGSTALAGTITGFVLNTGTTFSLVAERTGNFTDYSGGANISGNSIGIYFNNTSNTIGVAFGSTGDPTLTAADSSFHAAQGVEVSNTNCSLYVDGSSNNVVANCGNSTTSTSLSLGNFAISDNYLNGKIAEGIFWKAAMNSTNAGAVCHNQTVYYGISGATC